ncbi:MAG: hypothetical protein K2F75_08025, partial [Paramuribaculum sp.]|nr:hypothetical protein [Paramuribaculum sp.]
MMKFLLPAIAAIFLGACSTKSIAEADTNGWHLIWEETFNGESVDTAVWSRIPRGTADWNNYMTDLDTPRNLVFSREWDLLDLLY